MQQHLTVFTTERGAFHQQRALAAAPPELAIRMLRQPDRDTLIQALADAEYLISERVGGIDSQMLAAAPQLKLILRIGSLTYDIDTEAARASGVIVCRWPDMGVIRVAEHLVLQMLALTKKLRETEQIALEASQSWREPRRTDEDTFAYNWSGRHDIGGLWGRSVGILGFGEIGAELARRLVGWGCKVSYTKRRRLPLSVEHELGLTFLEAEALLGESDILVNLLPYFPETVHFLDMPHLAQMKDGAIMVSCGSGGTVDEQALADAVRAGKLAGAAMDSYDWEPIKPDNPLLALAREGGNILLTPHVAAGAPSRDQDDLTDRRGEYETIVSHLQGKPLRFRIV
jgi:phosphoglycerate dehydrogenase-like enzyme